jgi:hypothetical protein
LSPDGSKLAVSDPSAGPEAQPSLIAEGRAPVALPRGFVPVDWLDADTLIGYSTPGDYNHQRLATVKASTPGTVVDFPVQGYYVGKIGLG